MKVDDAYISSLMGVFDDLDGVSFIFYSILDVLGLYGRFMTVNMKEILGYGIWVPSAW